MKLCLVLVLFVSVCTLGCKTYSVVSPETKSVLSSWNENKWFSLSTDIRLDVVVELGKLRTEGVPLILGHIISCEKEANIFEQAISSLAGLINRNNGKGLNREILSAIEMNTTNASSNVSVESVALLFAHNTPDAMKVAITLMQNTTNRELQQMCVWVLGCYHGREYLDFVQPFVSNASVYVRYTAMNTLVIHGRTNDLPMIIFRTQDVNTELREMAKHLLKRYQRRTLVPVLLQLAEDKSGDKADEFCLTNKQGVAIAELKRLSGKDFGNDVRAWGQWWEAENRKKKSVEQ